MLINRHKTDFICINNEHTCSESEGSSGNSTVFELTDQHEVGENLPCSHKKVSIYVMTLVFKRREILSQSCIIKMRS